MDDKSLADAVRILIAAGARIELPAEQHLGLKAAAKVLDCKRGWIRDHLDEFPNAWRMRGGELRIPTGDVDGAKRRVQLGELRIPRRDIDAMAKRNRITPQPMRVAA